MSIIVKQLSYTHPDREILFKDISFSVQENKKAALIGNNGSGKSTLLQIIAGELSPTTGEIVHSSQPYYVPQHFGQYSDYTVATALQIDNKLKALHNILAGDASAKNFSVLDDDWTIEERATAALSSWGLEHISLSQTLENLSGGEKTKVFLAGITVHEPRNILLDEPTNHLDSLYREKVYELIGASRSTILVVSHDRHLLNLLTEIYELDKNNVVYYAGNYDFYKLEKEQMITTLQNKLEEQQKQLRFAKKTAIESLERKQKHEVRGKKLTAQKGIGKMEANRLQSKAEKSGSKLKETHADKIGDISQTMSEIRKKIPDIKAMKVDFNTSSLHTGKILVDCKNLKYHYENTRLWDQELDFQIKSGDRIAIKGKNGSGKTTLIKLITGELSPIDGNLSKADFTYVYLDQEYSIINNNLSVLEQILKYSNGFEDHEIKTILNRFLFPYETWDKPCSKLSGGEKMKLALSCLMVSANTPDMFILDEPTNNIDIHNIEILTSTIKDYGGTVLVVSHDDYFLEQIGVDKVIQL